MRFSGARLEESVMQILFISLGCDKNLVDTEHMLGKLAGHGYEMTVFLTYWRWRNTGRAEAAAP